MFAVYIYIIVDLEVTSQRGTHISTYTYVTYSSSLKENE